MDNTLEVAYKILYNLENRNRSNFIGVSISPKKIDVAEEKWLEVIETLIEEEYIAGITIKENILGEKKVDIEKAHITLKGAEYLQNNSAMAKLGKIATNVIDIIKK